MTKENILLAAAHIFGQKGYHATSMQDIADAVQLQKASLYYYFSSKQDILVSLLDQALDLLIESLEKILSSQIPLDEKLHQLMVIYMQTLAEHQDLARIYLLEYRSLDEEKRLHHTPRRDRFERLWRNLVQQGCQDGTLECLDPALAARALLGAMNWTVTWYRSDGSKSIETIADQFADLFLEGLLTRLKHP